MNRPTERQPASVSERATQAGELRGRWPWTESTVWTDRMLATLEKGVKGGRWFSLIDKVYSKSNLMAAYLQVAANEGAAGVDHVTTKAFGDRLDENLKGLYEALRDGTYQPQAVLRAWIPKPGSREQRPLGIPTVRDRVAQAALRNVLEPIFEREFTAHSYGFRPRRGCKDALRRVDELLKDGYRYVVDADLKSYFDTIPHNKLVERISEKVSDGRVLNLLEAYLKAGIMDGLNEWTPEQGTPQGAVISPLLSNVYLHPLDQHMAERGFEMVRYADDFVILCRSPEEAARALEVVQQWTAEAGLQLHPTKTRIVDAMQSGEGFDFLGYHFERGHRWPRAKSLQKVRHTIQAHTKRSNGHSLQVIITTVNLTMRGWFEYFKHTTYPSVYRQLDAWIRMRLRSILRKRARGRGRGRGSDHQRWTNAFFAEHGLYSLTTAYALARQSSRR